jgi:hypothetical protein
LPIIEGTLIHIRVDRLPGNRAPKPVWLWHSHTEADQLNLQRVFRIFLRRFDIEHTFRFLKQTLGWTRPRLRTPEQADRWTWLIMVAYTQLRLARGMTDDLRRPWEAPLDPTSSPQPASVAGLLAFAVPSGSQPAHRNLPAPALDAPRVPATNTKHPATPSANRPKPTPAEPLPPPHRG